MAQLQLVIRPPGTQTRGILVRVEDTVSVARCLTGLVHRLELPLQDAQGRRLVYGLRLAQTGQPLPRQQRLTDLPIRSGTHLLLCLEHAPLLTQPLMECHPSERAYSRASERSSAQSHWSRRAVLQAGPLFACCALTGLGAGAVTAFAGHLASHPPQVSPRPAPSPPLSTKLTAVGSLTGHQRTIRALAWSPNGQLLASGADDARLLLWTAQGQRVAQLPHLAPVVSLAWSPDGARLLTAAGTHGNVFEVQTGRRLARLAAGGPLSTVGWSAAPGQPLLTAQGTRVLLWESRVFHLHAVFTHHDTPIESLSVLPTQSTIVASASQGGAIRIWNLQTLQEIHRMYQDTPLPIHTVAFAPGETRLAAGGADGIIRLWNQGLVCQAVTTGTDGLRCLDVPLRLQAHTGPVRALAWSPDGHRLVTAGEDGKIMLWDVPQGQAPTRLAIAQQAAPVLTLNWAPDGSVLATASGKTITLWNLGV